MTTNEVRSMTEEEINTIVEKSPYYKATSNDVDWMAKVRMQGAIQKWVDHSISVTINLPSDAKEELVSELYLTAWKERMQGSNRLPRRLQDRCAGIKQARMTRRPEWSPPTGPKVLDADVIRFQNNEEKWIAFVGLKDGSAL
ncbi:MAG: hypothetical protein MZV63_48360 [Marinilabiliales bacterium]|nr:hypothetical protein [Marinilabiliales bacterium]